jgi:hypothetical protein
MAVLSTSRLRSRRATEEVPFGSLSSSPETVQSRTNTPCEIELIKPARLLCPISPGEDSATRAAPQGAATNWLPRPVRGQGV